MYLSTSTSTQDFSEMYFSTFQVLYKLYLSTDVLKYNVLLPGSASMYYFLVNIVGPLDRCDRRYSENDIYNR